MPAFTKFARSLQVYLNHTADDMIKHGSSRNTSEAKEIRGIFKSGEV
jgi:hypothetical protein